MDMEKICFTDAHTGALPRRIKLKKYFFILFSIFVLSFTSCVTLKDAEVTKTKDLNEYKYIIVNSTETLNSSVGATVYGGGYFSIGNSVNPGDVISGYLIKKGFVILKEKENDLINKTLIVNYGESGRRDVFWGYTTEVTIQFLTANTNEVVCVTTAEGIGDTEADDIKKAITRALDAVFLQ